MIDSATFRAAINKQTDQFEAVHTQILQLALRTGDPVIITEMKRLVLELSILFQASREWTHSAADATTKTLPWDTHLANVNDSVMAAVLARLDKKYPQP